jgi:hypothetical protein
MAGRIPDGPESVVRFISGMILQGMLTGNIDQRRRVALRVLQYVQSRIEDRRATYGDLSWAQEALHDLFYSDVEGTPAEDIHGQIVPIIDLDRTMHRMDEWCNSPADVMSHAATLQDGEQLLVNTWKVFFNNTFIDLEDQGINVPVGRSRTVEIVREGRRPRRVRIRRIDASRRPAHTQINENRDTKSGHQLLIYRDATDSRLKLYEPEITRSGQHLVTLGASGAALSGYFQDLPDIETYEYIQILGKITPTNFLSPFSDIP